MTDGRMLPTTRLDVDVFVRVDERWRQGTLEHWRRAGERWSGFVRYTVGVGQTHIGWFTQEELRPASSTGHEFTLTRGNAPS